MTNNHVDDVEPSKKKRKIDGVDDYVRVQGEDYSQGYSPNEDVDDSFLSFEHQD
jgi:hypothetical protein